MEEKKVIKIEELKNIYDLKDLEVKQYVSIKKKEALINGMIDYIIKPNEDGVLYIDQVKKEIIFTSMVVLLYTNIELTRDDYLNYDILHKYGWYLEITAMIGQDMYAFKELFDNMISSKLEENNIEYSMKRAIDDFVNIFDKTMEHLNNMIDKGDPNTIAKYLSKGIEAIAKRMPDFSKFDIDNIAKGKSN